MRSAIGKFAIFTLAVLAFVAVRLAAERLLYFPDPLSMALGFFTMSVIIKPLAAPDLPMSRWLVVALTGTAIALVILTAPRWYERWEASRRVLPDFLPTEEDFVAQVIYFAEGRGGDGEPRDCGTFDAGEDPAPGRRCAQQALLAGEAFYLFYFPGAYDTIERAALAASGRDNVELFHYSRDHLGARERPRARIRRTRCMSPRFLEDGTAAVQCGTLPTLAEFRAQIEVGKSCGRHGATSLIGSSDVQAPIECALQALADREAFHYTFETDWGGERGLVNGALSWQPDSEPAPILSYYFETGAYDDPESTLVQRACEAPRIRVVRPRPRNQRPSARRSSIEVDCGVPGEPR